MSLLAIRVGILTISDRSAKGERQDLSGPALAAYVHQQGWLVGRTAIVADEGELIRTTLMEWADSGELDLVLTTGGTGFAPRDMTPEATSAVIERSAPGLAEVIRAESLKITPHAMLSRGVAGIRRQTLIVNLPGSPKGAVESLYIIRSVLPHAVELLRNDPASETGHTPNP
jgi:molybdopterin adenylyltransferase